MHGASRILLYEQADEVRHLRQPCVLRVAQATTVVPECFQRVGLNHQQVSRHIRVMDLFLCYCRPSLTRSRGCATRTPRLKPRDAAALSANWSRQS
jgi:hypothetical protein